MFVIILVFILRESVYYTPNPISEQNMNLHIRQKITGFLAKESTKIKQSELKIQHHYNHWMHFDKIYDKCKCIKESLPQYQDPQSN